MATTNLATYLGVVYPTPVGESTVSFVIKATTVAAEMGTAAVNRIAKIRAKGISVIDGFAQCNDLDSNATPTAVFSVVITDGTTTKTLIDASTIAQAGGLIRPTKLASTENAIGFTTDNDDYYVAIVWGTGAATGVAGTFNVGLTLSGFYKYGDAGAE
jgi:hypothetical protein